MATKYYLMAISQNKGEKKTTEHVVEVDLCRYCWAPIPMPAIRRHEFWHMQTNTNRKGDAPPLKD